MVNPLETTFQVLTRTKDDHAVDVLVTALDIDDETVRGGAVATLIERNAPRGHVELIRRYASFNAELQSTIQRQAEHMGSALRQSLTHGDQEQRRNALDLVRLTNNHSQLPSLLPFLNDADSELRESAKETIRSLVNQLYDNLHPDIDGGTSQDYIRLAPHLRQLILSNLSKACSDSEDTHYPREIVESILILGDPASPEVKKVLWQATPECRELAAELLMTSPHPGVMDIVINSMTQNYPHPKAVQALKDRNDPEFICHLLRRLPKRLSHVQQKNFREIKDVPWLKSGEGFESIPPGLQPVLVTFVEAIGIPHEQKRSVHEWILKHGTPDGRMAAAGVLSALDKRALQDAVLDSLDSNDEDVQAWATAQLRTQGIPAAFTLLIERLDSHSAVVRDAARDELRDFDVRRVLGVYDHLSPETCARIGELLQKIDPNCVAQLCREMASPVQRRRIRAARAAEALKMQRQVLPALIAMSEDVDALVRRTAAEIMGDVPESNAVLQLKKLRNDPSQRVREAAARSLTRLEDHVIENMPH